MMYDDTLTGSGGNTARATKGDGAAALEKAAAVLSMEPSAQMQAQRWAPPLMRPSMKPWVPLRAQQ